MSKDMSILIGIRKWWILIVISVIDSTRKIGNIIVRHSVKFVNCANKRIAVTSKLTKKLFKSRGKQRLHLVEMNESESEEEDSLDAVSYDFGAIKSSQRKNCT